MSEQGLGRVPGWGDREMIFVLDNYDSFTYNLVQYLAELAPEQVIRVARNDELTVKDVAGLKSDRIVISPGPCTPNEAGISVDLIKHFAGKVPVLGVCLGHQAIAQAFGGNVVRAKNLMHGKTSQVRHEGKGVFRSLPTPFTATRYHSLVVDEPSLPAELIPTAFTEDADGTRVIMGLRHREHSVEGVQFHPESILTQYGKLLIANFLGTAS